MSESHGQVALWAVGLGLLTGAMAGSLVTTTTPAASLQYVGGVAVAATLTLAVVFTRRWSSWAQHHPFIRFVVYLVSLLVTVVVFDGLAELLIGDGPAIQVSELGAIGLSVGITIWLCCYGGAERVWQRSLAALAIDW